MILLCTDHTEPVVLLASGPGGGLIMHLVAWTQVAIGVREMVGKLMITIKALQNRQGVPDRHHGRSPYRNRALAVRENRHFARDGQIR
jgi:hypothetical protein